MIKRLVAVSAVVGLLVVSVGCPGPGNAVLEDPTRVRQTGGMNGGDSTDGPNVDVDKVDAD